MQRRIVFVTTRYGAPWGGSEELWSRTALNLVAEGFAVSASMMAWSATHPRAADLRDRGIDVWFRPEKYSLRQRAWRRLVTPKSGFKALELQRLFRAPSPDLVVFSDGSALPPVELMELCIAGRFPFVTIGNANWEFWWPPDETAERYRRACSAALRCYFVSQANRSLLEKQIGCELANAEIVRNPFNVKFDFSPAWPNLGPGGELQFACVGRLDPEDKGQDILFEVLSKPPWADRPWRLSLYGEGTKRNGLERLAQRLGISDRVVFAGFASVEEIWARNHLLVMPSRFEGLPLAMVEAMLCGRPVVATDVAGHAEIIEDGVTGFLADAPTPGSVAAALERFWARRAEGEMIGKAASERIRQLVPADPVRVFSEKLKEVIAVGKQRSSARTATFPEALAQKDQIEQK